MKERLYEEKGKIIFQRTVDLSDYIMANYEEKKIIGRGFSSKKTFRKIASIPIEAILALPQEQGFAILHDERALKEFLRKNPQFLCCEGNF